MIVLRVSLANLKPIGPQTVVGSDIMKLAKSFRFTILSLSSLCLLLTVIYTVLEIKLSTLA